MLSNPIQVWIQTQRVAAKRDFLFFFHAENFWERRHLRTFFSITFQRRGIPTYNAGNLAGNGRYFIMPGMAFFRHGLRIFWRRLNGFQLGYNRLTFYVCLKSSFTCTSNENKYSIYVNSVKNCSSNTSWMQNFFSFFFSIQVREIFRVSHSKNFFLIYSKLRQQLEPRKIRFQNLLEMEKSNVCWKLRSFYRKSFEFYCAIKGFSGIPNTFD